MLVSSTPSGHKEPTVTWGRNTVHSGEPSPFVTAAPMDVSKGDGEEASHCLQEGTGQSSGSVRQQGKLYPLLPALEEEDDAKEEEEKKTDSTTLSDSFLTAYPDVQIPQSTSEDNNAKCKQSLGDKETGSRLNSVAVTNMGRGVSPSAPPLPNLSAGSLLREPNLSKTDDLTSPLSPLSYTLKQIKSGNSDPAAIRRGLAAINSTPNKGDPGSAQRKREPLPSSDLDGNISPKKVCTIQVTPPPGKARVNKKGDVSSPVGGKKSWIPKIFRN